MIGTLKYIAVGAGALGLAGTAAFFGVSGVEEKAPASVDADAGFEVCLKNDIPFFEGVGAGCYSRAELEALRTAPLVNGRDDAVSVAMTHPTDFSAAPQECAVCADFRQMQAKGWYALSSRDMRREAFFVRACGVLDMLLEARKAEKSYFTDGSPRAEDMAALPGDRLLRLAGDAAASTTVEETSRYNWRFSVSDQTTLLQEIANADFDGDGVEEILVFLHAGPQTGTARVSSIALLEKDSADAPLSLAPQRFMKAAGSAGGAP